MLERSGPSKPLWQTTSNITVYREENYNVPMGTASGPDGGSGDWPDALVPAADRWNNGNPLNAYLISTVPKGQIRVVWVDVLVPQNAPAGVYNGSIAVTGTNFNAMVPITLTVFNATLPSTTSLKSAYLMSNESISYAKYGSSQAGTANEDEIWMLNARMTELALDNRVTICNSWYQPLTAGNVNSFNNHTVPLINGTVPTQKLQGAAITTLMIAKPSQNWQQGNVNWPNRLQTWRQQVQNLQLAQWFNDHAFIYPCDEPYTTAGTQARWSPGEAFINPMCDS